MQPDGLEENYYFGGGGGTSITALALCILVAAVLLILLLPRKHVVLPLLLAGLMIKGVLVVGGIHLMVTRLLIGVCLLRMLVRRDPVLRPLNSLDRMFIAWALVSAAMYTILWRDFGAAINRLGFLYNTLGFYFIFRYLIREAKDAVTVTKVLALSCIIISSFMIQEHRTRRNSFSIFGGSEMSDVREGKVRARGPFAHPIIAGTFGAMLMPLFIGLWWRGKGNRVAAVCGAASSVAIIFACSSSTPIMTVAAGVAALCCWRQRRQMWLIRRGLVICLLGLQVFMKVPVWFLLARIGGGIGGTGWHRAMLIDQFVRHFWEWCLIGTRDNASWGLDMWDSINAYVNAGEEGGLITFFLFLYIFIRAYKNVGMARALSSNNGKDERLIWAVGSTLFANTIAFIGITYFDQSAMAWYALLAMISVCPTFAASPVPHIGRGAESSAATTTQWAASRPEDKTLSWAFD